MLYFKDLTSHVDSQLFVGIRRNGAYFASMLRFLCTAATTFPTPDARLEFNIKLKLRRWRVLIRMRELATISIALAEGSIGYFDFENLG